MRFFSVIIFLLLASFVSAQKGTIKGVILGEADKEPVPYASVVLLSQADSTFVQGVTSANSGSFNIIANQGKYILEISFLGYENYFKNINLTRDSLKISLDTIYLKTKSIELEGMVVTAKVPDIVVKGDTIEYNAGGYKVGEGAVLEDLIKRIPGIEIDSKGNISANGKPINKILVDGKEFFNNDIKIALENLPVEMISKLQLYKEQSDMAKLTGFKDGEEQQVLNLKVKEEIKQSIFGNLEAGYGTDEKYNAKGMVNYMRGESQVSVIGDMGNVKDDAFMMSGVETNRNIGGRFNFQKSDKFTINGSVYYRNSENDEESFSNTQTFLETGDRFGTQNSKSRDIRNNLNADSYLTWKPDSLTNIFFRVGYQNSHSRSDRSSNSLSYVANKDTTTGWSESRNKNIDENINASLSIGRKLNKKGRSINMSLNTSFRDGDSNGSNRSRTMYSNTSLNDLIIDQVVSSKSNSHNLGFSVSYVEPIGEKNYFQVRYTLSHNRSERDRNTLKKDASGNYSVIDTAYTRFTENKYLNHNINLSFQSVREKYNYTIGFNVSPSRSESTIHFKDSLIENVSQSVVNFSPSLHFSYTPKENIMLNFDYSGSTSRPALSQLSADTVIINAQNKTVGNPDLKPSYNNNVTVYFQKSDYEKQAFLNISGNFGYTFNNVANYTTIDSVGNTVTSYRNVSGNMNTGLNMMYYAPFRNKKFNYSTSTFFYYQKSKGYTNADLTVTNNLTLGESLRLSFSAEKFNCYLSTDISHSITKNNLSSINDISSTNFGTTASFAWELPLDFKISSEATYTYNGGYSSDFKKSSLVWNASISKQFLKKKKGTLKVSVFDILDDRNTVMRTVYDGGITDNRSNTVNRYAMLSFIYKFNIFKGKKSAEPDDMDFYY